MEEGEDHDEEVVETAENDDDADDPAEAPETDGSESLNLIPNGTPAINHRQTSKNLLILCIGRNRIRGANRHCEHRGGDQS